MKKNIFIVILVLIILGLGGYLVYDKVIDKDKKENKVESKKEYTYKDLAGNYYFETNANYEEIPELKIIFQLVLDEKGTFNCNYSSQTPEGILGSYIIDGDKVILNYTLTTNSGMGLNYKAGSITLSINKDGTLTTVVGDEADDSYIKRIKGTKIVLDKNTASKALNNYYTFDEVLKANIEVYNSYGN